MHQIASAAFNGGRVDYANLVAEVFGNALGNSIVAKMSAPPAPVVASANGQTVGNFDGSGYRNSAIDKLSLAELGENQRCRTTPAIRSISLLRL